MEYGFLAKAAVYLGGALLAVPFFQWIGLGSVIGYLVAGVVLGPFVLGWVSAGSEAMHFSEFGVVILLFLIGLELNLRKLWALRSSIFGMGTLQVLGCITVFLALWPWMGLQATLIAAMGLSLSSTAIGIQLLREKKLLKTRGGETSLSVLLFQDMAVIPMLALLPLLAIAPESARPKELTFLWSLGAVFLVVVAGRTILRPMLRWIAATGLREIFSAFSLFLVIAISLLMQSVELSMGLGAFLAGVLLADSEYRHQLEADLEPFKGLLLGLFFMSVGSGLDLSILKSSTALILGLLAAVTVLKLAVLYFTAHFFGLLPRDRMVFCLGLLPGSEFAFVLWNLATSQGSFGKTEVATFSMVLVASLFLSPVLFFVFERWEAWSLKRVKPEVDPEHHLKPGEADGNVIVAGFGRFGQVMVRVLNSQGIRTTVLEIDPNQIELVKRFGFKTYYGDARRLDLLVTAGIEHAKLLVLGIDDRDAALETAKLVKTHFPHVKILARARNRLDSYEYHNHGIEFFRETWGSSLRMAEQALKILGASAWDARKTVKKFERHDLTLLERSAPHATDQGKLISLAQESRDELQRLLTQDQESQRSASQMAWD